MGTLQNLTCPPQKFQITAFKEIPKSNKPYTSANMDISCLIPASCVLADNHGKIRYLNESTISLLAMHEGSYVGKPFVGVIGIPKLIELYDRLKETPESETYFDISKPEKKYLCCKGKRIGSGFLFLITDVTEQRQLEIAMRNFIAEASHEFQTPMTVIKAAAEIMLDSPDLSKEEREELLKRL